MDTMDMARRLTSIVDDTGEIITVSSGVYFASRDGYEAIVEAADGDIFNINPGSKYYFFTDDGIIIPLSDPDDVAEFLEEMEIYKIAGMEE